jgi:oligo-1,6-glucosidase
VAHGGSPWWKQAVFYEIYPRSFLDTDGDGNGDLRGVISKLDYLKDLGVDALWLTPIFPSPWQDSGYDVADYDGIEPSMGTMEDFREFVDGAHRRDLRIILDLVINHTSDQHPWFQASRSSRGNPLRDFYIWQPGRNDAEPNNWKSLVKGSVWEWDEVTGEYYLHLFSKYQPDLNWRNPQVKEAIFAMMRRWLDRGVDGFRMDVINCLMKPAGFPDALGTASEGENYVLDRTIYADNVGMHELLQEMRREVLEPYQACAIGEVHFNTKEAASLYVDPLRRELDLLFQTDLLFDRTGPAFIQRSIEEWYSVLQGRGWNGFCLGNHDTARQVSALGDDGRYRVQSAKALAMLAFTAPGSPFVYQGDELGMTNVSFETLNEYRDIEMKSFFEEKIEAGDDPSAALNFLRPRSRDNARTPMQWSPEEAAGFTTGVPWIAVNPNYIEINAEDQAHQSDSVLQIYRRLSAFRREHPCLSLGDYEPIPNHLPDVLAYRRSLPDESLLIVINLSSQDHLLETTPQQVESPLFSNLPAGDGLRGYLRPWESRICQWKDA